MKSHGLSRFPTIRPIFRSKLSSALLLCAAALPAAELVDPVFRPYENGPSLPSDHAFLGGDVVWFDCRVKGYARSEESEPRFALKWQTSVIDRLRRSVTPTQQGKVSGELAAQDKEYRPRVSITFALPPLLLAGEYVIAVALEDEIAKTVAVAHFTLRVGGRTVELPKELTAAQFRYFRQENDRHALEPPVYRPGDQVWLRFDILGFQHGDQNKIDIEYGLLVLGPSGQPFLREDPAARHAAQSFYPQFYVPAAIEIRLPPKATPGEYIAVVSLRDKVSGQSAAVRTSFAVE